MAWTVVHHKQSAANSGSFCWLPYAQGLKTHFSKISNPKKVKT